MDLTTRMLRWFFQKPYINGVAAATSIAMNDFVACANLVKKSLGCNDAVSNVALPATFSSTLKVLAGGSGMNQGYVVCHPGSLVATVGPSVYTNVNTIQPFATAGTNAGIRTIYRVMWKKLSGADYSVVGGDIPLITSGPSGYSLGSTYPRAFAAVADTASYTAPSTQNLAAWEYYDWLVDLQCKIVGYQRRSMTWRDAKAARAYAAGRFCGGSYQEVFDLLLYMKQLGMIGDPVGTVGDVVVFRPASWADAGVPGGTAYGLEIVLGMPADYDYSYDVKSAIMAAMPIGVPLLLNCYGGAVSGGWYLYQGKWANNGVYINPTIDPPSIVG